MRKETFSAKELLSLFKRKKVSDLAEIKEALGTQSTMTAFRKLKQLCYFSSYSHRGKYYTIEDIAEFNIKGLWSFRSVRFSKYGTLMETARGFINISEIGYSARELEEELEVKVQETLLHLHKNEMIYREKMSGVYIYLSADPTIQERQLLLRQHIESIPADTLSIKTISHELKAAIVLFFSILDERQRRLYAGLESFKFGYGGDQQIANLLGLNTHTVAKGRRELFSHDFEAKRVRKEGGGRKHVEKKYPKL
ncbi:MAG: hypothetical protein GY865_10345 [candidate division Zixibacteria bacterium]|nr:hypothetical protein [candidate division Zixibacteria bacterium]